jgi:hypothetical protein
MCSSASAGVVLSSHFRNSHPPNYSPTPTLASITGLQMLEQGANEQTIIIRGGTL